VSSRRQSTGDGGHLCCEVARSRDPSRRLISTYRYLTVSVTTKLSQRRTRIVRSLSTIAALLLLVGCSRFDEAKERDGCQKAHPNDQVAADKCLETSVLEWEKAHAWLPRITHRHSQMP